MSRLSMKKLQSRIKKTGANEIVVTKFRQYVLKANDKVIAKRDSQKEMKALSNALAKALKIKVVMQTRNKNCNLKWDIPIKDSMGYMISRIKKLYPTMNPDFYNELVDEYVLYFMEQKAPRYNPNKSSQKDYFTFGFNQRIHEIRKKVLNTHIMYAKPISHYTNIALFKTEKTESVLDPLDVLQAIDSHLIHVIDYRFDDAEKKEVYERLMNLFIRWMIDNKDFQKNNTEDVFKFVMYRDVDALGYKGMSTVRKMFHEFYQQTYGTEFSREMLA